MSVTVRELMPAQVDIAARHALPTGAFLVAEIDGAIAGTTGHGFTPCGRDDVDVHLQRRI